MYLYYFQTVCLSKRKSLFLMYLHGKNNNILKTFSYLSKYMPIFLLFHIYVLYNMALKYYVIHSDKVSS